MIRTGVDRRTDGQTDRQTDGHDRHTIIRPVIDGRIKTNPSADAKQRKNLEWPNQRKMHAWMSQYATRYNAPTWAVTIIYS